jgi:hypothetical protein
MEQLIVYFMIGLVPVLVFAGAWRHFRSVITWHAEQRLYAVRDKVFNQVAKGNATFEEPSTALLIDCIHCWIHFTRDHEQRMKWLDSIGDESDDANQERLAEFRKLFSDPRYKELVNQACLYINLCIVIELFTRHFITIIPISIVMLARKMSARTAKISRKWFNDNVPIATGGLSYKKTATQQHGNMGRRLTA